MNLLEEPNPALSVDEELSHPLTHAARARSARKKARGQGIQQCNVLENHRRLA